MKILYAIQGTGNGHVSRARDIVPLLQKYGEVDVLISGTETEIQLPFPITYRYHGLCFVFGKKGGIDYAETYKRSKLKKFYKEIQNLPVEMYDLIISDFEPVSAWACRLKKKFCVGLSHQYAVLHKASPKPSKIDIIGKAILKYYAPSNIQYGFHFQPYASNIFSPVIRKEIRKLKVHNNGHYTVYLPAYSDKNLIKFFKLFPGYSWHIFSKRATESYAEDHIKIVPINNESFLHSIANCEGALCGAGFETPAEALFLQKKLLVIPMKGQYEQQCNAAALMEMGVPVLKNIKKNKLSIVLDWLASIETITLSCPDETHLIIQTIIEDFKTFELLNTEHINPLPKYEKFRKKILNKIFYR